MTDKTANTQTDSPERAMQRRESVTVGQIQWDGGKPWCDTCRKPHLNRAKAECRPKLVVVTCPRCGKKTRLPQEE